MIPLGEPRWRGQRGRTEVWYLTATDDRTGTGVWVHHEVVAPTGGDAPHAHGWAAVFPPDGAPVVERYGPAPSSPGERCELADGRTAGAAGRLRWDLRADGGGPPLFTFPRVVWERELLPGAQVVPAPAAAVTGTVEVDGEVLEVRGTGALARIYGHGSAERWGWLHADLGGGAVLEIVAAVARRPGLRRLPPLALVQLRLPGERDWPRRPLLAAPRFRTTLRPDGFDVRGRVAGRTLEVRVEIPAAAAVALRYVDPDGATATCTNSERASASIRVDDRRWTLDHRAHAEVGHRP